MTETDDSILATFHWVAGRDGWESPSGYPLSLCFGEVGDRSIGFETDATGSSLMTRGGIIESPTRAQVIAAEKVATDEKVLCVTRLAVDMVLPLGWPHEKSLEFFLDENRRHYRNRNTPNGNEPPVEKDDRWKQLIPYIVVVNKDGQILAYNRGNKGGEDRLESKWAIGFGGHVNDGDADWMAGIKRELREELDVNQPISLEKKFGGEVDWAYFHGPIGFINDDSDDVGRHHLGVVYILRADEVVPKENPEWCWVWPPDECDEVPASTERWSVLVMPMVRAWMESQ